MAVTLKRSVGAFGLMFTAVSGILGSGWLFGPYYSAMLSGPAAVFAWLFAFIAILLIAMTFAELACMFPVAGGNARFIYFTHGTLASFIFSWVLYLGYAAVAPIETMGVLQYLASVWPWVVEKTLGVAVLTPSGYGLAAVILLFLCVLNFQSIKWLSRYNSVIVWFKLVIPIFIGVLFILISFHSSNFFELPGGVMPSGFSGMAKALTQGGIILSFVGFAPVIVLAGEAKNPQKSIPLVLVGALGVCLLIYLLLQISFIGALSPHMLAHGWSALSFKHDASPFLGMADSLGLKHVKLLVFLIAIIAPLGTALIFVTTSARVAYAMAQNGYLPEVFKKLSKHHVPFVAIILNFVLGMFLFFPAPGWQGMVSFLVSAFVLCYAVGPVALLSLRKQLPNQPRPFRLPWANLLSFLAFFIGNFLVYCTGWTTVFHMLFAVLIGLFVLGLIRVFKSQEVLNLKESLWVFAYLIGLGVISYLGEFGGKNILKPGFDILVLFIFSGLILNLALRSKMKTVCLPKDVNAAVEYL